MNAPLCLPTMEMAREISRAVCAEYGLDARLRPDTRVVTSTSYARTEPCVFLSFDDAPDAAYARARDLAWEIRSRTLHRA